MSDASPIVQPRQRKPDWIRVKAPTSVGFAETRKLMRRLNLATVCEEAACPNIGECWTKKHATVMILGDTCTRACAFCNVKTGMPRAVDPLEPQHVADAVAELGLEHIRRHVGGPGRSAGWRASQFAEVVAALRPTTPSTTIEMLTPISVSKPRAAVESDRSRRPDVYNPQSGDGAAASIRRSAGRSTIMPRCACWKAVKRLDPTIFHQVWPDGRAGENRPGSAPGDG
jgi:lipoic acid synthetase